MKIALINTGGTISCVGQPLAPLTAAAFAAACQQLITPVLQQQFPTLTIDYLTDLAFPESETGTLDSTNLQPTDWCLMADQILSTYARYDGWVLLHGTDSLDFTGMALPLLLSAYNEAGYATAALSKPVIITGSQVPLFYQSPASASPASAALTLNYNTDAYQNLCGAVAAAQSGLAEVGVYFKDTLYRSSRVVKTNASAFNAFSSPNYPALGEYGIQLRLFPERSRPLPAAYATSLDNPAVRQAVRQQLAYVQSNINSFPVIQLNAFPAWYSTTGGSFLAKLIDAAVATGLAGLVLESYGEGNFPSGNPDTPAAGATYAALAAANAAGVVLVDCTQVLRGTVNDSAYQSGAWLPAVGALSPADLTPIAAQVKLMVLSTLAGYYQWPAEVVKTLMQTDLLGELTSVNRLGYGNNTELLAGQALTALDGSATLLNDPAKGPQLLSRTNQVLWCALPAPLPATEMPGRLVMQADGTLVFYDRHHAARWSVPGPPAGSVLELAGSYPAGTPTLRRYDCATNTVGATFYPASY